LGTATAIVDWYYAIYFSARAIFSSLNIQVGEVHSQSANAYVSTIRDKLIYPFDMLAKHSSREEYNVHLSAAPNVNPYDLYRRFEDDREVAQVMPIT